MSGERISATPRFALAFFLGASALACGGGGGDETSQPDTVVRSPAQGECDALMGAWCKSAMDCVRPGLLPEEMLTDDEAAEQVNLCIEVAKSTCDAASGVSDGYEACSNSVQTLDTADCEAVKAALSDGDDVAMPAVCDGVIVNG